MNTLTITLGGPAVTTAEVARRLTDNGFTLDGDSASIAVEGPDGLSRFVDVEAIGAALSHGRQDVAAGRALVPGSLALAGRLDDRVA